MFPAMRPNRALLLLSFCVAAPSLAGCAGGTETGNPTFQGALSYTGYSSSPKIGVRQAGTLARVDSAWFELGGVNVARGGSCGLSGDAAFSVPALGLGDHAAGNHNQTSFEAQPGKFCAVSLPFTAVDPQDLGSAPEQLAGRSLLIQGQLADGTPWQVLSRAAPSVALQAASGGFELDSQHARLLVTFDFAKWLEDADLQAASKTDAGIVISDTENTELLRKFEANLPAGVALYADEDGDGRIDAGAQPLAQGK